MKRDVPIPRIPEKADEETKKFYTEVLQLLKDLRSESADSINKQGEWTNVTYLNSWINFSTAYFSVAYMKDNFGVVHLRGYCKSGTTANPFTLPMGYRPEKSSIFPINSTPSGTTVTPNVVISDAGIVTLANYDVSGVSFDGITFKAV